jgi:hypothetical protein
MSAYGNRALSAWPPPRNVERSGSRSRRRHAPLPPVGRQSYEEFSPTLLSRPLCFFGGRLIRHCTTEVNQQQKSKQRVGLGHRTTERAFGDATKSFASYGVSRGVVKEILSNRKLSRIRWLQNVTCAKTLY